jgi:hypothetical protein
MTEHDEHAEKLEREADSLEHDSNRVGERIDETRRDWEANVQDPSVPGAQPDPADDHQNSEEAENVTGETPQEESDQLPEDAPSEVVPDDDGERAARDEAESSPGTPGDEDTATGNPDAAGAEDPDSGQE